MRTILCNSKYFLLGIQQENIIFPKEDTNMGIQQENIIFLKEKTNIKLVEKLIVNKTF